MKAPTETRPALLPTAATSHRMFAAALILGAALAAPSALADDPTPGPTPVLMPTGKGGGEPDDGQQPFDSNPRNPNSETNKIQVYGVDPKGNPVTKKTIRITNNTAETIYPMLRSPNNKTMASDPHKGLYDPFDPPNREYRGYIGYQDPEDGKYYFGLRKGESIVVDIPLVYWNGCRIHVGTEPTYVWRFGDVNNPMHNRATARRSITWSADWSNDDEKKEIGVVMWYRNDVPPGTGGPDASPAESPSDDSHDQIAEFTIRDNAYLVKISGESNHEIPDTEIVTLMNFDVSNVDNLYLPMAMAANDVWIIPNQTVKENATNPLRPNETGGYIPGSAPEAVGWTGAIGSIQDLQDAIKLFTAAPNTLLGNYFGGKGWPFYNFPGAGVDPTVPLKIPSGANVFAGSPLKGSGDKSSYNNEVYLLSSGGTEPIRATVGGSITVDPVGSTTLHLNKEGYPTEFAFIQAGYVVSGNPPAEPPTPDPIAPGTTVVSVDADAGTVTLSKPLVGSSANTSFNFSRPRTDYASDVMIRLWYSWVKYYLSQWAAKNPTAPTTSKDIVIDRIEANGGTMYFKEPHPEIAVGMSVEGPGLNLTETMTEVGLAMGLPVVLEVAQDHKSVILSQVPAATHTNQQYRFYPPTDPKAKLRYTPAAAGDPGHPLFGDGDKPAFSFSGTQQKGQDPWEFSQSVYLAMASLNQIGLSNSDTVFKAMQNIIGGNMGFIFTQAAKDSEDGQMLIAKVRDRIKSILRGVSDFTVYGEFDEANPNVRLWYPDPKTDNWGVGFNIYNLDPYVWFVHEVLKFTGYGFSLDDDTAQIGAGGANQLQLSITGTKGLVKTIPWAIQTPWGPVLDKTLPYSGPGNDTNGEFIPHDNKSISASGPITVTTFEPHKLVSGARIAIEAVLPANHTANGKFKVGNVTKFTFDLFDEATGTTPVVSNGPTTANGNWYSLPKFSYIDTSAPAVPGNNLTTVFYRVLGDDALGTFLGASVTVADSDGNVIPQPVKIRVAQPRSTATGRLMFNANLTAADGVTPLPAGEYRFSFGVTAGPPSPTPTPVSPTPPPVSPTPPPVSPTAPPRPPAAPTPNLQPTINKARRYLERFRNGITRARKSAPGPARVQTISELQFCAKVARAVIAHPSNKALVRLLDDALKATKIKNLPQRAQRFIQLEKRFQRIR